MQVLIAVAAAVLADILINHFRRRTFRFPENAVINGLLIAMILEPNVQPYIPAAASIIAVTVKHLLKIRHKAVLNPANIGLLVSMVIFNPVLTWWGASSPILLSLIGIFFLYKFRMFPIAISYVIMHIIAAFAYASATDSAFMTYLVFFNFLFVFVMVIEPVTAPFHRNARIIYGSVIALLAFVFTAVLNIGIDGNVLALFIGNALSPLLNKVF